MSGHHDLINMKVLGEESSEMPEGIDVDMFIANDKRMTVSLKKNFTKKESNYIMAITSKCSTGRIVNWRNVAEFFESDCDQKEVMKKIKNHYYNKRSVPARVNTKRNDFRMSSLGLDI